MTEPTEGLPQDPNATGPVGPTYGSYHTPRYGEPHQGQPGYGTAPYPGAETAADNSQQFYGDSGYGPGYQNPTARYPSVTDYYGDGTPRSQPQYSEPQYDQFGRPIYFQGQTPPPAPPRGNSRSRLARVGGGLVALAAIGTAVYLIGVHRSDEQAQQRAAVASASSAAAANSAAPTSAGGGLGGLIPSIPSLSLPSGLLPSGLVGTPGQLPADLPAPGFGKAGDITTRSLGGFTVTSVGYTGATRAEVDSYVAALNANGWTTNTAISLAGINTLDNAAGTETVVLTLIGGTLNITVRTS